MPAQPGVEGPAREKVAWTRVGDAQHPRPGGEGEDAVPVPHQRQRGGRGPLRHGAMFGRPDPLRHRSGIGAAAVQVKTQPRLRLEEPPHRRVDPFPCDTARLDRRGHGVDRRADAVRSQQHIRPGLEGEHRRLARAVALRDRAHAQRVGEEEAAEPHLAAQQLRHQLGGHRRGAVVAEHSGHRHVCGHHRVHARVDRHAEGDELHPVEAVAVGPDDGQLDVRIGPGVAVPGEVLGGRERTSLPGPPDEGRTQSPHGLRIFAEGADVDHRVVRIAVHVEHRRKEPVNAHRPGFFGRDAAVLVGEVLVTRGAEGHRRREAGSPALWKERRDRVAVVDSHPRATVLEVRGHQERNPGPRLQSIELRDICVGDTDGDRHAAQSLFDPSQQLPEVGVALGRVASRDPGDHQLGDGLAQRHAGHGLVHPAVRAGVQGAGERGGSGGLRERAGTGARPQQGRDGGGRDDPHALQLPVVSARAGIWSPAPIPNSPILVGALPVTAIRPRMASAAARSATGTPDHAVR